MYGRAASRTVPYSTQTGSIGMLVPDRRVRLDGELRLAASSVITIASTRSVPIGLHVREQPRLRPGHEDSTRALPRPPTAIGRRAAVRGSALSTGRQRVESGNGCPVRALDRVGDFVVGHPLLPQVVLFVLDAKEHAPLPQLTIADALEQLVDRADLQLECEFEAEPPEAAPLAESFPRSSSSSSAAGEFRRTSLMMRSSTPAGRRPNIRVVRR
jgi:hypothetical protein